MPLKTMILGCLISAVPLAGAWAQSGDTDMWVGLSLHSKYVSEGRDNLARGGVAQLDLALESGPLFAGLIQLEANRTGYRETQALFGVVQTSGAFEYELSLTRLYAGQSGDRASDNEIGAALSYNQSFITPFAAYAYSTEASGGWLDLGISTSLDFYTGELTPYLLAGLNQGYVVGESYGLNHLQLGAELAFSIYEVAEVTAYLAHSQPWSRERGDTFDSLFWGGIGVSLSF